MKHVLKMTLIACLTIITMSFTSDNNGEVKFATTTHDFEKIEQGKPVTTTFKFTNHAEKPLIIKNVKTTCGCTAPDYPKRPILNGQSGEITVKYDAKNAGIFKKSIAVHTNMSEKPVTLYIKGEVLE